MTLTFEQVLTEISVSRVELVRWIEQRWVLPEAEAGGAEASYRFDEIDLARLRLIAELRRDFDVNEEAMPLILQLLDQVYALRRALGELQDAIDRLPEEARGQLDALLRQAGGGSGGDPAAD